MLGTASTGGDTEGDVCSAEPWLKGRVFAQSKYENYSEVPSATKEAGGT